MQRIITILICLFCLVSCSQKQNIESYKYDSNILLNGVVISIPKQKDDKLEFVFHTDKYGDFLLKSSLNFSHYIEPANKLELDVKLYNIHEYANINAFNYSDYLENKNISAIGFVNDNAQPIYNGTAISYLPQQIRYSLYNYLNMELKDNPQKSLVLALLIGDKNLSDEYKTLFQNTGASHLMVISGLHIGLMALVAFVFFRLLWSLSPKLCRIVPAQYVAMVLSLLSAVGYSLMAGFSIPTQRAVIMLLVFGMFWLLSKRVSLLRSLVLAFVLVVILDYKSLYNIGTWLSFSAVASLVFISTILSQYRSKFTKTILTQVCLSIFLIPITIYYFNGFSSVSILANIIAIPFVSFVVVPLLFVSLLLSFIGVNIWLVATFCIKLLVSFLELLQGQFSFVEYEANFSIISLIVVLLGMAIAFLPIAKSFRLLGAALVLVLFQPAVNTADKHNLLRMNIFDTKELMVMIQDNGTDTLYISASVLEDDYTLENVLKPYLHHEGVISLDNVIIAEGKNPKTDILSSIINVQNITRCGVENSWNVDGHIYKPLKYGDDCILNIQTPSQNLLIIDSDKKTQQQIFSLYGRMLQADIIISSQQLTDKYITELEPKYLIYSADSDIKASYLDKLTSHGIKTIDTNNNGAITVEITDSNKLTIKSLLKNY